MAFTSTKYTSSFYRPSTPNINNINMAVITQKELNTAINNYNASATNYVNTFNNYFKRRNYILDLLQKDILCEATLAKKNLQTNQYTANVKADNYYAVANNGYDLTSQSGIQQQYNQVIKLASELFVLTTNDLDQLSSVSDNIDNSFEGLTLSSEKYDSKALTLNIANIVTEQTDDIIFINDIANATENSIQLSSYIYSDETNTNTVKYTIKNITINNIRTWVLIDNNAVTESNNGIIATITLPEGATDILTSNITFQPYQATVI